MVSRQRSRQGGWGDSGGSHAVVQVVARYKVVFIRCTISRISSYEKACSKCSGITVNNSNQTDKQMRDETTNLQYTELGLDLQTLSCSRSRPDRPIFTRIYSDYSARVFTGAYRPCATASEVH